MPASASGPDPVEVAEQAASAFEITGIPYLIGGSMASTLHGEVRTTFDVDFAAHVGWQHVSALAAAFENRFFVDIGMIQDAVRESRSFNVIHRRTFVKVDVFVTPDSGFDRSQMHRAVRTRLSDTSEKEVRVASAEDIVLQKLLWYRMTEETSDRQWRDVLGVLKIRSRTLDRVYLDRWADQLGLAALLERAMRESGLPDSEAGR